MRLVVAVGSVMLLAALIVSPQPHEQGVLAEVTGQTQVEFYVAGNRQAAPNYRVRSFRRVGKESLELAGRFRGLAAQGIEQGEYEYALEPVVPLPGPPGNFTLTGKAQLYGARLPHWITLQMPDGVIVDYVPDLIAGRFLATPVAANVPFWIRFQHAVDHSQFFQMKLGTDGTFRIPSRFDGNVVVTVCRGRKSFSSTWSILQMAIRIALCSSAPKWTVR